MKFFETVCRALDVQVPALAADLGITVPDLYGRMAAHLPAMRDEWTKGSTPDIAYHDPVCRLAYLFSHVAINANLFYRALTTYVANPATEHSWSLGAVVSGQLEATGRLKVCAFGGGPGTELLALSKYVALNPPSRGHVDVELLLLDRVREWGESWEALKEAIYDQFQGQPRPFSISYSVLPFDMTNIANFGTMTRIFDRNIFILNHVISEVFEAKDLGALSTVLRDMTTKAPSAIFLVLDRNDDRTRTVAAALLTQAGIAILHEQPVGGSMDGDEQKDVLAAHSTAIGRQPRVQWQNYPYMTPAAFFAVGVPARTP